MVAEALAGAREAERRVAILEAKLERSGDRALRLTAQRDEAGRAGRRASGAVKPKVVRERVVDGAVVARAERRGRLHRPRPRRRCMRFASSSQARAWMPPRPGRSQVSGGEARARRGRSSARDRGGGRSATGRRGEDRQRSAYGPSRPGAPAKAHRGETPRVCGGSRLRPNRGAHVAGDRRRRRRAKVGERPAPVVAWLHAQARA